MKRLNCQRLCTHQRNEPLLGHGKIQSGNHQKGIDLIAKQSRKYYRENLIVNYRELRVDKF